MIKIKPLIFVCTLSIFSVVITNVTCSNADFMLTVICLMKHYLNEADVITETAL